MVFSLLATLAFAFIALRTIRDVTVLFLNRGNRAPRPSEILFFHTQLGYYAGCIVLSNFFISVAGLINFNWLSRSGLSRGKQLTFRVITVDVRDYPGSTCSAQGETHFRGSKYPILKNYYSGVDANWPMGYLLVYDRT